MLGTRISCTLFYVYWRKVNSIIWSTCGERSRSKKRFGKQDENVIVKKIKYFDSKVRLYYVKQELLQTWSLFSYSGTVAALSLKCIPNNNSKLPFFSFLGGYKNTAQKKDTKLISSCANLMHTRKNIRKKRSNEIKLIELSE